VAFHEGHGYVFGLLSPGKTDEDAQRQLFDSTRESFHFTD